MAWPNRGYGFGRQADASIEPGAVPGTPPGQQHASRHVSPHLKLCYRTIRTGLCRDFWHLSQDRKSSEQFTCFNRRNHEMKVELALSGIVPSMMSDANQEEAI